MGLTQWFSAKTYTITWKHARNSQDLWNVKHAAWIKQRDMIALKLSKQKLRCKMKQWNLFKILLATILKMMHQSAHLVIRWNYSEVNIWTTHLEAQNVWLAFRRTCLGLSRFITVHNAGGKKTMDRSSICAEYVISYRKEGSQEEKDWCAIPMENMFWIGKLLATTIADGNALANI